VIKDRRIRYQEDQIKRKDAAIKAAAAKEAQAAEEGKD
jgi:hypothetical protein